MKIALKIATSLFAIALVAIAAQQYRYAKLRDDFVADRQAIFHSMAWMKPGPDSRRLLAGVPDIRCLL